MESISATAALPGVSGATGATSANGIADLDSQDFFKLLISQLTNQDPLEPMDNQDLLNQISSIRDIELSTSLTASLQSMVGQQRYASASAMIGRYVKGIPGENGLAQQGIVTGVRFGSDGAANLQLADGGELAISDVVSVEPADQAARSYIGSDVVGLDRSESAQGEPVQGRVTGVSMTEQGGVALELDSGQSLRIEDLVNVLSGEANAVTETLGSIF